jgi:ERCC4-type nuclease
MGYLLKRPRVSVTETTVICVDDRERHKWSFNGFKYPVKLETKRLQTGDYSIKGLLDKIAVEKKNGISELAVNISAQDRERFIKTLGRLSSYKVKYFVIEDCISNVPKSIKKLPRTAKISVESIYYWLTKIQCEYKIPVIWLGKTPRQQQQVLNKLWEHILEVDVNRRD